MNFFHNIEHNFTHFNSPAHIFNIAPAPHPISFNPPPSHPIPPFKPPTILPPFIMPPPHMIQLQPKEQHPEQPQPQPQQPPQVAPVAVVDNTTKPATQSTFSNFLESDSSYILYGLAGLGIIIYVFKKK